VDTVNTPGPLPAHLALDPTGLHGNCYRCTDRPPILSLDGAGWVLALSSGTDPDPAAAAQAADKLLQLATEYAEATHAWAGQHRSSAACQTRGDNEGGVGMRTREIVDVRVTWRAPRWVRVLLAIGRCAGWLGRSAWWWRFELGVAAVVLFVRATLASILGLGAATLAVAGLVAGLLIWPVSRRWLVGRAWCAIVRRRLVACLRVTRTGIRRGGDLPVVLRSQPTVVGERVTLWCRIGQSAEQIGARIAEMRSAAWCQEVRVTRDSRRAHLVYVEVIRRDTLAGIVPALPLPDSADLTTIPVGRTEFGGLWRLRLLGTHLLVAGVTGAGKGSVVWSLLRGIAPAVRSGLVQVWAVDPKGGMELGLGRPLFTRFAHREYADMVGLLEDAVAVMRDRAARLAGAVRLHTPTVAEPLVVVLVDEVANLTAYLSDRDLRRRAEGALALLLTQGRAVGVSVVTCLQDPRKEVLGMRNLFPTKVALRLDEPSQVDMVLGDGARDRGALADSIPDTSPGVGYAREDGSTAVIRVRAGHVTDPDITGMAERYPAPNDRPFSTVGGEAA